MKHFKVILSLSAAIACAGLTGCSKPQDPASRAGAISTDSTSQLVPLKIKWTTGKRYEQKMTMDMDMNMNVPGMPKPVDNQVSLTQTYSIAVLKELPEGGNELELSFDGEKLENKMDGKVMSRFDSDEDPQKDAGNPLAPTLRKMVGARVNYQTDAAGKVTKILNYDEFISRMAGGNPQAQAMMKSMMNEQTIKSMGTPGGQSLPEKPVKIGDHWPVHMEVPTGIMGTLILDMTYTFKGWQQHDGLKCAVLGLVGNITSKSGSSPGGMNLSIEKGTMLGDNWFDPDAGMVRDAVSEQNMDVKMAMQGKSMTSVMKQKIDIKLVQVTDAPK